AMQDVEPAAGWSRNQGWTAESGSSTPVPSRTDRAIPEGWRSGPSHAPRKGGAGVNARNAAWSVCDPTDTSRGKAPLPGPLLARRALPISQEDRGLRINHVDRYRVDLRRA